MGFVGSIHVLNLIDVIAADSKMALTGGGESFDRQTVG
jgi:hypothetical protein